MSCGGVCELHVLQPLQEYNHSPILDATTEQLSQWPLLAQLRYVKMYFLWHYVAELPLFMSEFVLFFLLAVIFNHGFNIKDLMDPIVSGAETRCCPQLITA